MNHNFTYLKPKSFEDIFGNKSNLDIKELFCHSNFESFVQEICLIELLRRNAYDTIMSIRLIRPATLHLIEFRLDITTHRQVSYYQRT